MKPSQLRSWSFLVVVLSVSLVLQVAPAWASKEDGGSGVVYGKGHVFKLGAPKGWIFDNESGRTQGVHAVIYPVGDSWGKSKVVIYAGSTEGKLAQVMASDLKDFQDKNPAVQSKERATLTTACGRKAVVREFTGDRFGNLELVAYIETPQVVCEIVLSARSQESFEKGVPAFEKVVRSFKFLSTDWDAYYKSGEWKKELQSKE